MSPKLRLTLLCGAAILTLASGKAFCQKTDMVDGTAGEYITHIDEDTDGNIIYSTLRGLFKYNGNYITTILGDVNVTDFTIAEDGVIWYIRNINSLRRYSEKESPNNISDSYGPAMHFLSLPKDMMLLSSRNALSIINTENKTVISEYLTDAKLYEILRFSEKTQNIYAALDNKILVFNTKLSLVETITLPNDAIINTMATSSFGDESSMLIGTTDGVYRLSEDSFRATKEEFLPDGNILFLEKGIGNVLVTGVRSKGIFLIDENLSPVRILENETLETDRCICHIQSSGRIWISQGRGGLLFYTFGNDSSLKYRNLEEGLSGKRIYGLSQDSMHRVWILADYNLFRWNSSSSEFIRIPLPGQSPYVSVMKLFISSKDDLWVETDGYLKKYRIKDNSLIPGGSFDISEYISSIIEDIDGTIYFRGTGFVAQYDDEYGFRVSPGAKVPSYVNQNLGISAIVEGPAITYRTAGQGSRTISIYDDETGISYMLVDKNGLFWCVSNSLYVSRYDPSTNLREDYLIKTKTGSGTVLASSIFSIQEDGRGGVWLGTNSGLVRIDNIGRVDFFNSGRNYDYFLYSLSGNDGNMYFAYSNGITAFDRNTLEGLSFNKDMHFKIASIMVNYDRIGHVTEEGNFVSGTESYKDNTKVHLGYNQNNISFDCTYTNFDESIGLFSYMLEGKSNDWVLTTSHLMEFPELPPGEYTFKVRLGGLPVTSEKTFSFVIARPPWKSRSAICLYILLFLSALVAIMEYYKAREKRLSEMREKQMREDMDKMKINFFTDISHEFRTPLTLLSGPLDDVIRTGNIGQEDLRKLELAKRSSDRLLQLTNQLLEYNNIDKNYLVLSITEGDIVSSISTFVDTFSYEATRNGVSITFSGLAGHKCGFDEVKLRRIMSNLVSNAIKYSPDGGSIDIKVSTLNKDEITGKYGACEGFQEMEKGIEISVSDTGIGIPKDKLESIFERYRRAADDPKLTSISGFGIGLHYTRQLVSAHGGYIIARHNSPAGSVFSFIIPEGLKPDSVIKEESGTAEKPEGTIVPDSLLESEISFDIDKRILAVDDDPEMLEYISGILSDHYEIITVSNGQQALDMMRDVFIDLVISDVMMPKMSGFELCRTIKKDPVLSSIPVMLLTAKGDMDSRIAGLNVGADMYVTKPFDSRHFMAMVNNVLANHEKKQQIISRSTSETLESKDFSELVDNETDMAFLQMLYSLIDSNLGESQINMDFLIRELGQSRTGFYMKMKSLTGKSPGQFVTDYKMSKAAELLAEGKHSIKEIALMVGYESSQSFSRVFKKSFGLSPTEYMVSSRE